VGRPFPLVRAERIAQAHEEVAEWLARSPTSAHAVLAASASAVHPSLALHILETFYGDATGPADYDEDVRASLLLLLRTLTDALDLGAPDQR